MRVGPTERTLEAVLEVVVGLLAGLLFLIGLAIMAGPVVSRALGRTRRRTAFPRRAAIELHPTTAKAVAASTRLLVMLKDHRLERHATALRMAARRLQLEEASGIQDMRQVVRHLRNIRLEDESDQRIFLGLLGQLQRAVDDRAEQLEVLPRQ